jgi:hypothetical protein
VPGILNSQTFRRFAGEIAHCTIGIAVRTNAASARKFAHPKRVSRSKAAVAVIYDDYSEFVDPSKSLPRDSSLKVAQTE